MNEPINEVVKTPDQEIRDAVLASLTSAEIGAAMLRILNDARKTNPKIRRIQVSAYRYSHPSEAAVEWVGNGSDGTCAIDEPNAESVIAELARQISAQADALEFTINTQ